MENILRHAVLLLLHDSMDTNELEVGECEDGFADRIAELLVINNGGEACPFKNYSIEDRCPRKDKCGSDESDIDCGVEAHETYILFMETSSGEKIERYRED